jgi:transposase
MASFAMAESPAVGTLMPGAEAIHPIKLNGVDPYAYLADTLTRIVDGHLASAIDELLPWAYVRAQPLRDAA